jgi:hypothetical protein
MNVTAVSIQAIPLRPTPDDGLLAAPSLLANAPKSQIPSVASRNVIIHDARAALTRHLLTIAKYV